jgi:hypothetical protein
VFSSFSVNSISSLYSCLESMLSISFGPKIYGQNLLSVSYICIHIFIGYFQSILVPVNKRISAVSVRSIFF